MINTVNAHSREESPRALHFGQNQKDFLKTSLTRRSFWSRCSSTFTRDSQTNRLASFPSETASSSFAPLQNCRQNGGHNERPGSRRSFPRWGRCLAVTALPESKERQKGGFPHASGQGSFLFYFLKKNGGSMFICR